MRFHPRLLVYGLAVLLTPPLHAQDLSPRAYVITPAKHQSLKVSYSDGTYLRFGGNYNSVQVGWQYSWIGWPAREK